MQSLDKTFFVHRTGTGYNFEVFYFAGQLIVRNESKLFACNYIVGIVGRVVPQSYLTGYFCCCAGSVACHNFHFDAGVEHFFYSSRHSGSYRVGDSYETDECQIVGRNPVVAECRVARFQLLIGKSECSHGLGLIAEKHAVDTLFGDTLGIIVTEREDDFRRAFDIEHFASVGQTHNSSHIFTFGRERQFGNGVGGLA